MRVITQGKNLEDKKTSENEETRLLTKSYGTITHLTEKLIWLLSEGMWIAKVAIDYLVEEMQN